MLVFGIMIVLFSLLAAAVGVSVALRLQYRVLTEDQQERSGWQEAQAGHQRVWEGQQKRQMSEVERKLAQQIEDMHEKWQYWQQTWNERARQDDLDLKMRIDAEHELARLPHVESITLSVGSNAPENWRPPVLYRADLRGRDLSYRYLGRADLRQAQLIGANLYMADLTGAVLTGANLTDADLIGANLTDADLRDANLSGANLLVADLHRTLLYGAILLDMQNLAPEQLETALYDPSMTDPSNKSMDMTLPRLPSVNLSALKTLPSSTFSAEQSNVPAPQPQPVPELPTFVSQLSNDEASLPAIGETPVPELPIFVSQLSNDEASLLPPEETFISEPSTFVAHLLSSDSSLLPLSGSENGSEDTLLIFTKEPVHHEEPFQTTQALENVIDENEHTITMPSIVENGKQKTSASPANESTSTLDKMGQYSFFDRQGNENKTDSLIGENDTIKAIPRQTQSSESSIQPTLASQGGENVSSTLSNNKNDTNGNYKKNPRKRSSATDLM